MKRTNHFRTTIPLIIILLMLCFSFGCQPQVDEGLTREEVQIILDRDSEIWNEGKIELVDEHITSDYLLHSSSGEEIAISFDDYKKNVVNARINMPDRKDTILDLIFQDDKIVVRWKFTGTETGPSGDRPPSGTTLHLEGIYIARIVDGKVAEVWNRYDTESAKKQFGFTLVPPSSEEEAE